MGEISDMILDGILDEQTGEFIDDELSYNGGPGYPRTMQSGCYNSMSKKDQKKIKAIKKEIALKAESLKSEGIKEGHAYNLARAEANKKYGKGWRTGGWISIQEYYKNKKS
ncbi:MAG: hypothetical protein WD512_16825 [Candidatus Paceibacterota bacterium]